MKVYSIKKQEKEIAILFGLIELYIKNGKPIGSNTLKESGLDHLSSATIRNYFLKLEEQGYLTQQHASGGRIPTDLAYKFYINHPSSKDYLSKSKKKQLEDELTFVDKEIIGYFNKTIETLSELSGCAAFISSPRFDQDSIVDIKLLALDPSRLLCIILTSFGIVHTEVIYISHKMSNFSIKRIEAYLHFKRTGLDNPLLEEAELTLGDYLYHEILLRHIVGHATFTKSDLYKTGFSKLLHYPELQEPGALANTLSLFENSYLMERLCEETCQENQLKTWVGHDLEAYIPGCNACSIIMVPYTIRQKPAGVIGLLGPTRLPYKYLFEVMKTLSKILSDTVASLLFKYQMNYRMPKSKGIDFKENDLLQAQHLLLQHHSNQKETT